MKKLFCASALLVTLFAAGAAQANPHFSGSVIVGNHPHMVGGIYYQSPPVYYGAPPVYHARPVGVPHHYHYAPRHHPHWGHHQHHRHHSHGHGHHRHHGHHGGHRGGHGHHRH